MSSTVRATSLSIWFPSPFDIVTVLLTLWSAVTHKADNIMWTPYLPGVAAILLVSSTCIAELAPEPLDRVEQLPAPNPHWVWVNDVSVYSMPDGKSHLIDGDTGRYLGVINTGYGFLNLTLPAAYDRIYAAETYYSRGTRGERTDLISIYDPGNLSFIEEIVIPAKRASTIPTLWNAVLTDDQSFMVVFNLTPATSLSVVDLAKRSFVGEIAIPGCGLALPAGGRRVASICGDGTLMLTELAVDGTLDTRSRSEVFFDPATDPVTEKAVRYRTGYLFVSVEGMLHQVEVSGESVGFSEPWSLVSDAERQASWRVGGMQHLAVHAATGRLYALMLQGPRKRHKDSGVEVWIWDLPSRRRVQRISLNAIADSIQVSPDEAPLLFTSSLGSPSLEIYDALSGVHLRSVSDLGQTPSILQTIAR